MSPLLTIPFLFLLTLAFAAPTTDEKPNIWVINIFKGPAPSPDKGPPAAAHALRDSKYTKYQAIGIAGAYLLCLVVVITSIIVVKRRAQRRYRTHNPPPMMDTYKPTGQVTLREIHTGPKSPLSPKSPGKMSSIRAWAKGNKVRNSEASIDTANTRIDERTIEHDRAKNMDEMAKLYAAVMLHDEERTSQKATHSADSSPITDDHTPVTPRTPRSPSYPPEMAHPAYVPPVPQVFPQQYPQSYPQQYSQQYSQPYPVQPYPQEQYEPAIQPPHPSDNDREALLEGQGLRKSKPTTLSIISSTASRLGSSHSNKARPSPITVRGQPISKPLGSADLRQSALSPSQQSFQQQSYTPGPPPPTPGRGPGTAPITESYEMHGRTPMPVPQDNITTTTKALPFRQFYKESLQSAPPTKTTFLDRRTTMNGPKTGVPKTPYSPYCPTTPMTPVTPRRLLNKEELKKNKKQYALQAVSENEMVQGDDDMWGK